MKFQSALMPPPLHYNHYGDFDMYPSRLLNCFIIFKKSVMILFLTLQLYFKKQRALKIDLLKFSIRLSFTLMVASHIQMLFK